MPCCNLVLLVGIKQKAESTESALLPRYYSTFYERWIFIAYVNLRILLYVDLVALSRWKFTQLLRWW